MIAPIRDQLTRVLLEEGIKDRIHDRAWYRERRWPSFETLESENIIALRALLKVRSAARRAIRAQDRRDARTLARKEEIAHEHHTYLTGGDTECRLCEQDWYQNQRNLYA